MAQIRVNLAAPGKRGGAWRLPDDWLIGMLIQNLVGQLGLSTEVNWQLVPTKTKKPLATDGTLAQVGIRPGATLKLEPVRNKLLKTFLEKLYDEAASHVQDELWDKALAKMEELHEYDPRFPDPKGLRKLAEMGITPSAAPSAGIAWGVAIGGLVLAGTLAVGATAVVGGGGYLLWRASQQEKHTPAPLPTEPGGGSVQPHTGDVQITLEWYDEVDLDLHVYDPNGDHIYYDNRQVASGGELDVDANYLCMNPTSSPLENVYWPWGGAPEGEYEVYVYYINCGDAGTVEYRVIVRVDGEVLDTFSGSISPNEDVFVTRFSR